MVAETDKDQPFFLSKNSGFGTITDKDDLLHPASFDGLSDPTATETQYFGFSVPEENIHALMYLWWHPNLKVCSGGAFVWQGVKSFPLAAELMDWRVYMRDTAITENDIHSYRLDNGYGVEVIEPLKSLRATYADPANGNAFDVTFNAVLPPVLFGDGNHFEQTMKATGDLTLRGKSYKVDCYNVRDRSWGKARPESVMPIPPMTWMTGTFRDDFSFNCNLFDHASGQPERDGDFVMPDDQALNGGWVYKDGTLGRVIKGTKRIVRRPGGTTVSAVEVSLEDDHGRTFDIRGTLVAACPIQPWINAWMTIHLMRWECEGLVGHGDLQDAMWGPFINSRHVRALA